MPRNKKSSRKSLSFFAIIILLILSYFWYPNSVEVPANPPTPTAEVKGISTPTTSDKNWYEVYFTSPKIPFDGVTTGGIENHLIDKINASQSTIDLAVYEFDLENVAQALIAAHNRGVIVRVVYDNEFSDPDPQMAELQRAGISTIPDERGAFMHNKFFIFDHQCVWTGSFNISVNAAYRNNENALYFCSPDAAQNYATEFQEMYTRQFGPTSPANTPNPIFTVRGFTVENYFAPEDQVMAQVISEVSQAQKSIHFLAFSFTSDALGEAMLDDLRRGLEIAGVFETRGASAESSECLFLLQSGALVSLDGNPRTLHDKVIIIDSQIVILGSFNFSNNADEVNDENLLIIHDPSLASAYEAEFLRLQSQSLPPLPGKCSPQ